MDENKEYRYRIFICWFFIGIGIGLVISSMMNFQNQISVLYLVPEDLYDKTLVPSLEQISYIVPQKETIVSSGLSPLVMYFTKHNVSIPWSAYSEESLVSYMEKNNHKYLLVFEDGFTYVEALGPLFSHEGLKRLDKDFKEIARYPTKDSHLHLYQRII